MRRKATQWDVLEDRLDFVMAREKFTHGPI